MSIYGQIIILFACYRAIRIRTNETHNNKYTLKSTPLATNNKTIFHFECPRPREQSVVPWKLQTW